MLEPVHELHDPQSPERQLLLPPPSPARQPAPKPARTAPEQPTSGSAPSIGSGPPARKIIKYTSEMSPAVQGWDAATKGKKLKQPTKSQKGKAKAKRQTYKSQHQELNALIQVLDHYVWKYPFLSEADLAEKTMLMKRFHAWYLKACDLGLT